MNIFHVLFFKDIITAKYSFVKTFTKFLHIFLIKNVSLFCGICGGTLRFVFFYGGAYHLVHLHDAERD